MNIIIAGIKTEISEETTITELIKLQKVESPEYVSVSLNDDFVERAAFDTTVLSENDIVEFLYFMGGGQK